jgi:hypothetical protein
MLAKRVDAVKYVYYDFYSAGRFRTLLLWRAYEEKTNEAKFD